MKLNLSKSVLGFFLIAALSVTAQTQTSQSPLTKNTERCKSAVLHHKLMQTDPQYAAMMQEEESKIQQVINSGQRTGGVYVIPVVVHVLNKGEAVGSGTNISDAQINSAIANMNSCYSGSGSYLLDIGVQFQLAQRSPTCGSTTGIIRVNASAVSDYATNGITSTNETTIKAISKWPNSEYYNIWIVSEIDGNDGGAGTQGYAYFPGASSAYDGAVILYNSFGYDPNGTLGYNLKSYTRWNVTANHELGHAFNLYHTFEGDDSNNDGVADQCPANVTCTSDGDKCCDTEAHNRNDGDCGSTGTTCTGQSLTNIVQNIMSYSSDVCQVMFTADQKTRIRAAIEASRGSLLTSPALLAVTGSAPLVTKTCSPQSTNLSNSAGMGVYGLTIGGTSYSSSGTVADGGFRNNWCGNFSLAANTTYSITVDNYTQNPEKVKVYIDYNNNGNFADAGENVYSDNVGGSTHTGSFTTIASPVTGQAVWIRVISDFSNNTISDPCYAPQYGQVEDFSVTFSGGCIVPSITGTTPGSRCGTGTVVLGATASAGTLNWYAVSSGGSSLGTGTSFTTPSISTTTTYYVDATNGGCTSARTAVVATVNTIPTVSGTTPGSRCGTGTVVLGATASAGTLNWYAASSGGSSLGAGISFTTPSISTTTTYYVDATNGGCTSARTAVIATVNTIPTVSGTTPGSRCGTGTVVLGATASAGTLNWYAVSSGGSSLGTGVSFTTPSISTTTTYYVDATNGGCTSARTAVIATVNTIPTVSGTTPGSRCGTGTVLLGATASAGTLNWYAVSSGGNSLGTGTSFTTPSISTTTTYYVDATSGCTSARTAVDATINSAPVVTASKTDPSCNGGSDGTATAGASGATPPYTYSWSTSASTQSITGLTAGTYTVTVSAGNGCNASQTVTVLNPAALALSSTSVQSTCSDNDGTIDLSVSGGTPSYNYSWSTGATTQDVSGLSQGTYTVTVVDANGCSAQHIKSVTQNCNSIQGSQLVASECGATFPDLTGYFNCVAVLNAQDYEWEFTNSGLGYSYTKQRGSSVTNMLKTAIVGLAPGNSYNVRVRAKVGGVWGNFGSVCAITISGSIQQTQLVASECGATFPDLSGYFDCVPVSAAQDYEWEFTNSGLSYSYVKQKGNGGAAIQKTFIVGLVPGNSYNVRVRAKVGGTWGSFGSTCVITISGTIQPTQLVAAECGQSATLAGYFNCNLVSAAQDYEWEFTNAGLGYSFTKLRGAGVANMVKSAIVGLMVGNTYNVRIRAQVGGVWGTFGPVCTVTISSVSIVANNDPLREYTGSEIVSSVQKNEYTLTAYPNPSGSEGFDISIEGMNGEAHDIGIKVFDLYGRLVWSEILLGKTDGQIVKINGDGSLAKGIYIVNADVDGTTIKQKVIIH